MKGVRFVINSEGKRTAGQRLGRGAIRMIREHKWVILMLIAVFYSDMSGCVRYQSDSLPTRSGRVEVDFGKMETERAKSALITRMITKGWYPAKVDPEFLVMEKKSDNLVVNIFAGSRYDPVPLWRANYALLVSDGNCIVFGQCFLVTNPGSAFERIEVAPAGSPTEYDMYQGLLAVKSELLGQPLTVPPQGAGAISNPQSVNSPTPLPPRTAPADGEDLGGIP